MNLDQSAPVSSGHTDHYLKRHSVIHSMSRANNPALYMCSGETVTVETYDCFHDQLLDPQAVFEDIDFSKLNPATGPIYVEEAAPGTMLKIDILDILLNEWGCTEIDREYGTLADLVEQPVVRRIPVRQGKVHFSEHLRLDLHPMIGVIGVAPEDGEVATDCPASHGGNMDCTLIAPGATLYLPVFVPGALFALGDLHACMGDGEIGGCGLEVAGQVKLRLSILHQRVQGFPIVANATELAVIASEATIENAWTLAVRQMYTLLRNETSLSSDEVIMLLSLCGNLAICQTVNPQKTVRMSIPLRYALDSGYSK
ncbi:MAG: acetamidase/formamidase family protein [Synergistaceae bacterium]|jgi:amidase|nr:acetamidase/formamidase family protein [Synergistaceae bacterium]